MIAKITVTTPCTCEAVHWFECTCSEVIAEYDCEGIEWDTVPIPTFESIQIVRAAHPGMRLVYIDGGLS